MKSLNKHKFILLITNLILFLLLFLILDFINKPCTISVTGTVALINNTSETYFDYVIYLNKNHYAKLSTMVINIFLTTDNKYFQIIFPQWIDNDKLLIFDHIQQNQYFNQTVLIITGQESILVYIFNNIQ